MNYFKYISILPFTQSASQRQLNHWMQRHLFITDRQQYTWKYCVHIFKHVWTFGNHWSMFVMHIDLPIRNIKTKNRCLWFPLIRTKHHTLNKFLWFLMSSWNWWHSHNLCCVPSVRGFTWSTVAYFMDVVKHAIFLVFLILHGIM